MCKKMIFASVFILLFFTACSPKIDETNPVEVVRGFILLCEDGKVEKAKELLTKNHNLLYLKKFEDMGNGKDLFYIDYDYKGNDDIVELTFENLKEKSSPTLAVIKLTSNYKRQHHTFTKNVVLHKVKNKWKIHDFMFMPVKVK
ncbi:hypothetical protein CBLAS_0589 [Campylobacter blaseri]|uniref:DUF4878 domain-containing protein n=1 Tax=Campylobacter blaseri TaxID=2042961 RepID=A0A2P8R054_9BACT|nr:hypothetical protein [Campylobacter blaseri]PSM51881.1 hypothetical protein CQ405_04765 [Campylobacter blaseri]PSM53665.1 hypothetical protein CRN67_04765 [Campylobacter blaseri]QKF85782.1 hypothetical protein CBLAS_0589 [Campylobacter blaseri]